MQLSVPNVRIADVETCDFGLMPSVATDCLLRAAHPTDWRRYRASGTARRFLAELGVERRYLTHIPGEAPMSSRLNADNFRSCACNESSAGSR